MLQKIRNSRLAFTLVELAIVLAVTGVMFGGLYRLMAGGNSQLRDQSASASQQQLISAVKGFLASQNGLTYMNGINSSTSFSVPLPTVAPDGTITGTIANKNCKSASPYTSVSDVRASICDYLPVGFTASTTNSYGQTYIVQGLKDTQPAGTNPNTYSFVILTSGGTPVPDTDGGRISSLIGGDGGFIYSSSVCGAQALACGSYGGWSTDLTGYGYAAAQLVGGQVASRTYVAPEQNSSAPWLARNGSLDIFPSVSYHTMATDLYMGKNGGVGSNINMASPSTGQTAAGDINLAPSGVTTAGNINMSSGSVTTAGNINMSASGGTAASLNMAYTGATTGGGAINLQGGTINGSGTINMNGGTVNMNGGPINMGGGGLNMQSGTVDLGAGGQITGAITDPTAKAINVSTSLPTGNSLITANMPCTILSYNGSNWVDAGGNTCSFAVQANSVLVSGVISANAYYATNSFVYGSSDRRLKTNIQPLSDGLQNVMKLKPVSFTYKETGTDSMGVIAQDLEEIYPVLVAQGNKGMKYVAYDGLIAPLISSVQELKKENDELRQKLTDLRAQQGRLEKKLDALLAHKN